MSKQKSMWVAWLALALGIGAAPFAQATSTWTFTGTNTTSKVVQSGMADAVWGVNITGITGLSAENGAGNSGFAAGAMWSDSGTLNYKDKKGLGLSSGTDATGSDIDKNLRFDNTGYTEALMLTFNNSVVLSAISIMERSGDADVSIWRYTGTTAPVITSVIANDMGKPGTNTATGWELVSNYANLENDDSYPYKNYVNKANDDFIAGTRESTVKDGSGNVLTSGSVGSSWWLISAYNTSYSGTTNLTGTGLTQGDDYFRIYAIAARLCDSGIGKTKPGDPPL